MTSSSVLARVAGVSEDEVLADLERVRAAAAAAAAEEARAGREREQLEAEEAALEHLLVVIRGPRPIKRLSVTPKGLKAVASLAAQLADDDRDDQRPEATAHGMPADAQAHGRDAGEAPRNGAPSSKRAPILAIMREHPEKRGWSPAQMRTELARRGISVSPNSIRVTMARMANAGQLTRPGNGLYSLADDQAALTAPGDSTDMGAG